MTSLFTLGNYDSIKIVSSSDGSNDGIIPLTSDIVAALGGKLIAVRFDGEVYWIRVRNYLISTTDIDLSASTTPFLYRIYYLEKYKLKLGDEIDWTVRYHDLILRKAD